MEQNLFGSELFWRIWIKKKSRTLLGFGHWFVQKNVLKFSFLYLTKKKRQMQLENSTVPVYIKFIFHVLNKLIGNYELSLNV